MNITNKDLINIITYVKSAGFNPIMFENSIKGVKKLMRLKGVLQEEGPKIRDIGLNADSYLSEEDKSYVPKVLPNKFASLEKKANLKDKLMKSILFLSKHPKEITGTSLGMFLGGGIGNIIGSKIGKKKVEEKNPNLIPYLNKIKELDSSEKEKILNMLDLRNTKNISQSIGTLGGAGLGAGGAVLLKRLLKK